MATNPWDAFPAVEQQAGPVYGAPLPPEKPREAPAGYRWGQGGSLETISGGPADPSNDKPAAPPSGYRWTGDGGLEPIPGGPAVKEDDKPLLSDEDRAAVLQEARTKYGLIQSLDDRSKTGWFSTGFGANIAGKIPATEASDVARDVETVSNSGALQRIMELARTNGGKNPLTPLSNADFQALSSSVANIDPTQSDAQFQRNLGVYRDIYRRAYQAAGGDPADLDKLNVAPPPINDEEGLQVNVTDDSPNIPPTGPGGGGGGLMDGLAQGVGSIVEGAASIPALVVDPLATTLGRALGYDNYTSDFAGRVRSDLGLPANQDSTSSAIIRGGTSALTGAGLARGAVSLASSAPVRNALSVFGGTPIRDTAAGAGAGLGGEIGRELGGTPGQVVGALAGGVAGYGGASALARQASGIRTPNALLAAADRQGVEMLPGDVGGVGTRMATGATGMTLGGIPLAEGAQRSIGTAQAARGRIASAIGDVGDDASAGQAARRGFKDFSKSSEQRAGQLYERVSVPNDSKVQLGQTRGALSEVTRGMQSNPELSRLWANHPRLRATLEALTPTDVAPQGREAFSEAADRLTAAQETLQNVRSSVSGADAGQISQARQAVDQARADVQAARQMADTPPEGGELSWEDMKRFRSIVGEIVGQPGVAADGSDVAGLRKLYGALSSDMEVSAAKAGPKALQEFRRASQYWRGRESRLEDVFSTLFGNRDQRSDEAVFRTINQWAQSNTGDFSRIARTIRSMPEDEANTVRATIVSRMGMASPARGGQDVFTPDVFATQWKGMSNRAKNVLFPNKQHRSDLEDLATVTDAMKRAGEYRNSSKTALGANLTGTGITALSGPAGLLTAAAYSGGTFSLGKLLASPRFARVIASTKKLPEDQAARRISDTLSVIATREPALMADAKGLQEYLSQAVGQSPAARAAASDQEQQRRREPVR